MWNPDGTWKHSKFNKRALEALISIKALDSLDCVGPDKIFSNYKQMHEILINHNSDIKKHTKKNPFAGMDAFRELLKTTSETDDWTRKEFVNNCMKFLSNFNPMSLLPEGVMNRLNNLGVKAIDEIEESNVCWFIVTSAKPKTTKTNKPYLMLEATGCSGQNKRIFCWGWDGVREFPEYSVCIAEVIVDGYGCKTFMNKVKFLEVG